MSTCFLYGEPNTGHRAAGAVSQESDRGKKNLPCPAGFTLTIAAQDAADLLHCRLMFSLLSRRTHRSVSAEVLSGPVPTLCCCKALFHPRCRTAFSLVEFHTGFASPFVQHVKVPLTALTSSTMTAPPSWISSVKL